MTMWAKRENETSSNVEVHVTHGPVEVIVKEAPGHVRAFWSELGRLLDEVETKEEA